MTRKVIHMLTYFLVIVCIIAFFYAFCTFFEMLLELLLGFLSLLTFILSIPYRIDRFLRKRNGTYNEFEDVFVRKESDLNA